MLAAIALAAAVSLEAQAPAATNVSDVLAKARRYADTFVERFSNVVAEERYVQEMKPSKRRRELTSDFYLVALPGATSWTQLRDVFSVDGQPVRDRGERLSRLVMNDAGDWLARATALGQESARYNLTDIGSFNLPLNAFALLQRSYQDRMTFVAGSLDSAVGSRARVVQFREKGAPLFDGRPLRGRFWIDEATGAVLKTELMIGNTIFASQIVTSFMYDAPLDVWVPREMREQYPLSRGDLTGVATYGRFRRFGVTSQENYVAPR